MVAEKKKSDHSSIEKNGKNAREKKRMEKMREREVSIIHEEPLRYSSLGQQEREASEELAINKDINNHTDF